MPLIIGSKSEDKELKELVSSKYRSLKEYRRKDEIEAIKSWLQKQPHLPNLTDDQILVFLHACYYSTEKAKKIMDNYFTYRTHAPELFTDRNPNKALIDAFKVAYFVPLPEECKTYDGHVLAILKLRDPDPNVFNFLEAVKADFVMMDLIIARNPLCEGFHVIMDMKGVALGHLTKLSFTVLKKFMLYVQEAMPIRLKGIHVVNTFPLVNQIMAILKPFMKQHLLDMISFYTTSEWDTFTNTIVPKRFLPSDYGGNLESLENLHANFCKTAMLSRRWLEEMEKYKVEESKRMGKSNMTNDVFGLQGSFKKLELD